MATRLATILVIVIVGATFIAGLIVGAQRDDANGPATTRTEPQPYRQI